MLQHAVQIILNESEQELMNKTSDILEITMAHINCPHIHM